MNIEDREVKINDIYRYYELMMLGTTYSEGRVRFFEQAYTALMQYEDSINGGEVQRDWYFTFGQAHKDPVSGEQLASRSAIVYGTRDEARDVMRVAHGNSWSMQYPSAAHAGVKKYNYQTFRYVWDITEARELTIHIEEA